MPKINVIFTVLFMSFTAGTAGAAQMELYGHEQGLREIEDIDIAANAGEEWEPSGVRILTETQESFFIYTENGSEAMAVRASILEKGFLKCKVQLGTSCASYEISEK